MDLEKIFNDLESNQSFECEETKRKLVELFTQTKEQWLVHYMMEYYLKTGSARIIEVLVSVQAPHDGYIFDRLADWLRSASHRLHALNLFCFVVRRHPTWLFKVEKHRLIKDLLHWLKQLEIEKEIVPLMSALLAIIILLPIIPSMVPNFLNDLFMVFAHLASWNSQNTNRLPEDKLLHLQLGLQMLFHRLYGMFPCNFIAYLTEFTKREKGAIFQHTIRPLLETVRLHPLLITATAESEINSERWKEVQPHDVVVECMRLSLPFNSNDAQTSDLGYGYTPRSSSSSSSMFSNTFCQKQSISNQKFRESQRHRLPSAVTSSISGKAPTSVLCERESVNCLWSPYHEIVNSSHTPLTPTPAPYMMPLTSALSNLVSTGCSPPEAAVEATPETTPLKENTDFKRSRINSASGIVNPLAVKAIFVSSQPSSPLRMKDVMQTQHQHFQQHQYHQTQHQHQHQPTYFHQQQQQHFNFPDIITSTPISNTLIESESNIRSVVRVTSYDRRVQQILQDRKQSQSPFQTIESQANKMGYRTPPEASRTPEIDTLISSRFYPTSITPLSNLTATPIATPISTPLPLTTSSLLHSNNASISASYKDSDITGNCTKICDECNETDQTLCTEGGLQMPTSRSMHLLAKGIQKRNRMTSSSGNGKVCEDHLGQNGSIEKSLPLYQQTQRFSGQLRRRRSRSCSSLMRKKFCDCNNAEEYLEDIYSFVSENDNQDNGCRNDINNSNIINSERRQTLKKCRKLAISSAFKTATTALGTGTGQHFNKKDKCVQTIEQTLPTQSHEQTLTQMLIDNAEYRSNYESTRPTPNEILDKFIACSLRNINTPIPSSPATVPLATSATDRYDNEQFQLLCLQLQYERYRREIHAERNRRLMGRSRDKRSLEMERDRLREQLKDFEKRNRELNLQLERTKKSANERHRDHLHELEALKANCQNQLEQNRSLRQKIENLKIRMNEDLNQRKTMNYELESLRGQVFTIKTELQHAQKQAELGLQCKEELARLEAEFIVMGEVQIKCKDHLTEVENLRARDAELQMLQNAYNNDLRDLKRIVDDKNSQLDSARHKIQELQLQLLNNEKVITEQKRILKAVKDEYEEKFKAVNKKYNLQRTIILQMEEKFAMSLHKPTPPPSNAYCSPDRDKIALSGERNSPLSTSLASSDNLSMSLKSSDLRNLQQLVETPIPEVSVTAAMSVTSKINNCGVISVVSGTSMSIIEGSKSTSSINVIGGGKSTSAINIVDNDRLPSLDLASSANTVAEIINVTAAAAAAAAIHEPETIQQQQQYFENSAISISKPKLHRSHINHHHQFPHKPLPVHCPITTTSLLHHDNNTNQSKSTFSHP